MFNIPLDAMGGKKKKHDGEETSQISGISFSSLQEEEAVESQSQQFSPSLLSPKVFKEKKKNIFDHNELDFTLNECKSQGSAEILNLSNTSSQKSKKKKRKEEKLFDHPQENYSENRDILSDASIISDSQPPSVAKKKKKNKFAIFETEHEDSHISVRDDEIAGLDDSQTNSPSKKKKKKKSELNSNQYQADIVEEFSQFIVTSSQIHSVKKKKKKHLLENLNDEEENGDVIENLKLVQIEKKYVETTDSTRKKKKKKGSVLNSSQDKIGEFSDYTVQDSQAALSIVTKKKKHSSAKNLSFQQNSDDDVEIIESSQKHPSEIIAKSSFLQGKDQISIDSDIHSPTEKKKRKSCENKKEDVSDFAPNLQLNSPSKTKKRKFKDHQNGEENTTQSCSVDSPRKKKKKSNLPTADDSSEFRVSLQPIGKAKKTSLSKYNINSDSSVSLFDAPTKRRKKKSKKLNSSQNDSYDASNIDLFSDSQSALNSRENTEETPSKKNKKEGKLTASQKISTVQDTSDLEIIPVPLLNISRVKNTLQNSFKQDLNSSQSKHFAGVRNSPSKMNKSINHELENQGVKNQSECQKKKGSKKYLGSQDDVDNSNDATEIFPEKTSSKKQNKNAEKADSEREVLVPTAADNNADEIIEQTRQNGSSPKKKKKNKRNISEILQDDIGNLGDNSINKNKRKKLKQQSLETFGFKNPLTLSHSSEEQSSDGNLEEHSLNKSKRKKLKQQSLETFGFKSPFTSPHLSEEESSSENINSNNKSSNASKNNKVLLNELSDSEIFETSKKKKTKKGSNSTKSSDQHMSRVSKTNGHENKTEEPNQQSFVKQTAKHSPRKSKSTNVPPPLTISNDTSLSSSPADQMHTSRITANALNGSLLSFLKSLPKSSSTPLSSEKDAKKQKDKSKTSSPSVSTPSTSTAKIAKSKTGSTTTSLATTRKTVGSEKQENGNENNSLSTTGSFSDKVELAMSQYNSRNKESARQRGELETDDSSLHLDDELDDELYSPSDEEEEDYFDSKYFDTNLSQRFKKTVNFTTEDKKTFKRLDGFFLTKDFQVHEEHTLETKLVSGYSKDLKKKFEELNMIKLGTKYTPFEDKIIKRNWKKFCEIYKFRESEGYMFSKIQRHHAYVMEADQFISLMQFIGRGLPKRTLQSIFYRFQCIVCTLTEKKGRFEKEEDETILKYIEEHEDADNKFYSLSKILNRGRKAIYHRYMVLKNSMVIGRADITEMISDPNMIEQQLKLIMKVSDCKTVKQLDSVEIPWRKINRVNPHKFHCARTLWWRYLYTALHIKEPISRYDVESSIIETLKKKKFQCLEEVDWPEVAQQLPGFHPIHLSNIFSAIKTRYKYIPEKMSWQETIEFMEGLVRSCYARNSQIFFTPLRTSPNGTLNRGLTESDLFKNDESNSDDNNEEDLTVRGSENGDEPEDRGSENGDEPEDRGSENGDEPEDRGSENGEEPEDRGSENGEEPEDRGSENGDEAVDRGSENGEEPDFYRASENGQKLEDRSGGSDREGIDSDETYFE